MTHHGFAGAEQLVLLAIVQAVGSRASAGALTRGRRDIETSTRLQGLFGPAATPAAPVVEAIPFTRDYGALSGAAFVIENVTERGVHVRCSGPWWMPKVMAAAGRNGLDPGRMIIEVCKVDRVNADDAVLERAALQMTSASRELVP